MKTFLFSLLTLSSLMMAGGASSFAIDTPERCKLGDEWTKHVPDASPKYTDRSSAIAKALYATAKYVGGTAFYLGKFNRRHLVATNFHVVDSSPCVLFEDRPGLRHAPAELDFPIAGAQGKCVRTLSGKSSPGWSEIDFAILEIHLSEADAAKLKGAGLKPAFGKPLAQGTPLVSAGFGTAGNYPAQLQVTFDDDCRVFSKTQDFRLMADPDPIRPASYMAWSFAQGCDGSHGDSGSAFLDRNTGEWVGVLWTGSLPKPKLLQNSKALQQLIADQDPRIWTDLNYAVPIAKIQEKMRSLVSDRALPEEDLKTIQAWLNGQDENAGP